MKFLFICVALSVFFLSSCNETVLLDEDRSSDPLKLSLEDFPQSDNLSFGRYLFQVMPKRMQILEIPQKGDVVEIVDSKTFCKSGSQIALFSFPELKNEEKSFQLNKEKIEVEDRIKNEIDFPREQESLLQKIRELESELNILITLSNKKELAELNDDIFKLATSEDTIKELELSLLKTKKELNFLIKQKLALHTLQQKISSAEQQSEAESLSNSLSLSSLKADFSGIAYFQKPKVELIKNYNGKAYLGTLEDYSKVDFRAELSSGILEGVDLSSLSLVTSLTGKDRISFGQREVKEEGVRSKVYYVFTFQNDGSAEKFKRVSLSKVSGELFTELSEPHFILPKLDLVKASDGASFSDWDELVSLLFGDCESVIEGADSIAIRK